MNVYYRRERSGRSDTNINHLTFWSVCTYYYSFEEDFVLLPYYCYRCIDLFFMIQARTR